MNERPSPPAPGWRLALCCLLASCASASPGSGVTAEHPAASPAEADVPLQLRDGRTAIEVRLDGGPPILANYDTGSQGMVMSEGLATRLGLQVVGEALLGSPAGGPPIPAKLVELTSLSVGGMVVPRAPRSLEAVLIADTRLPAGVELILGNRQFPRSLIELDFAGQRFRLAAAERVDSSTWNQTDERGLLAGTLQIGAERVPLHIDSGNPGLLDLPLALASRLPLRSPPRGGESISLVDRTLPVVRAELDLPATLAGNEVQLSGSFRFVELPSANLGARAMRLARLRIDTARQRWTLQLPSSPRPQLGEPAPASVSSR
ncbi:MAG TPA: retropepsin-like aspartic protease [Kofleriaceae bacterium]|nr:retropepsin-like aspartic protease [Kofleriaceae bacterium]